MANAVYLTTAAVTYMGIRLHKGLTLALTPAQVTAIGPSNLRAVNNPANTNGSHPASETHDTLGEAAGTSNSS